VGTGVAEVTVTVTPGVDAAVLGSGGPMVKLPLVDALKVLEHKFSKLVKLG
jgi:hypothetical protein